jgi:hypothetical protein
VLEFPSPLGLGVYQCVITTNVTDAAGNHLAREFRWTFAILGGGPNDDDDSDGLTNEQELQLGTNPFLADSDGDGWEDGVEVADGKNPLNSNSRPVTTIVASPPLQIVLPGVDETGQPGEGTVVANPSLQITLPGVDETGVLGPGAYFAFPPLQIFLPGADETGLPGAGTFFALPPITIQYEP